MSVTGLGSVSIRKRDLTQQKQPSTAYKRLTFAHKATGGETGIDLGSLTAPTEMTSIGFSQASQIEICAAKLKLNRKNLTIHSSSKGVLQDWLSYEVVTNTQINFTGFTADAGEIFTFQVSHQPTTGVNIVDASPLVATGTLAAGTSEFNIGHGIEINKYSTQQVGAVTVYIDGVLQYRNVNNATAAPSADGNYQEIGGGAGLGSILKFNNTSGSDRAIVVISTGLMVNNPDDSRDQALESLAGQVDAVITTLADAAGVPEDTFQTAPNNIDLRAFGDRVNSLSRYHQESSAYTAVGPCDRILADTTGGAFSITLPLSPDVGDQVEIWDSHSQFGSSSLTVARNGQLIEGAASDFVISTDDVRIKLVYVGASRGWILGDMT